MMSSTISIISLPKSLNNFLANAKLLLRLSDKSITTHPVVRQGNFDYISRRLQLVVPVGTGDGHFDQCSYDALPKA
jgi:hypothetical protein